MKYFARFFVALCVFSGSGLAGHDQPTLEEAAQALDKAWIKLTPDGMTERNVLFESIEAGQPNGETYPFRVTVTIRDYGPGYPPNSYFGQTCVTKIPAEPYRLTRDAFGDWQVQGRMNVFAPGDRCEENPAEGATSIALDSLPGEPASATPAAAPRALAPEERAVVTGDWSCSGNGQVLFGFALDPDGSYRDGDGNPAGSFAFDPMAATISFTGGPFDGRIGTEMDGQGFGFRTR